MTAFLIVVSKSKYYFKFLNNVSSEENLNNVRHPLLIKRLRFEGKIIKTIIYNKIYIYIHARFFFFFGRSIYARF